MPALRALLAGGAANRRGRSAVRASSSQACFSSPGQRSAAAAGNTAVGTRRRMSCPCTPRRSMPVATAAATPPRLPRAASARAASGEQSPRIRRKEPTVPTMPLKARRVQSSSELHRRRLAVSAKGLINASAEDPRFWQALVSQPGVVDFLRRSLVAKTSKDAMFAEHVLAATSGGELAPVPQEAAVLASEPRAAAAAVCVAPVLPESTVPACSPIASALSQWLLWADPAEDSDLGAILERLPQATLDKLAPVRVLQQGASTAAQDGLDAAEEGTLKRRRRVSQKGRQTAVMQSICGSQYASNTGGAPNARPSSVNAARPSSLPLGSELTAMAISFLDIRSKVSGVCMVSTQMRQVMESRAAWDPLHLDHAAARAFLRLLKRRDPLGWFGSDVAKTKRFFPSGLFDVTRLSVVLMNPERPAAEQSDTEDDTPRPKPLVVADPLDEMCKRLQHYFSSVNELTISNIEDYRMDHRFVALRAGSLGEFGLVELVHCPTSPPTYALMARKDAAPRFIDLEAAKQENKARVPRSVQYDESTTISEREALYLAEHRSAYKNGDDFHLVHAMYRTVRSHGVRKRYKAVVLSLRQRFPQRFMAIQEIDTPGKGGGGGR